MSATKAAVAKARKAGYALPDIQWPEDATPEQLTPGIHHNPFSDEQPEEKQAWLEGLKERLSKPTKDPMEILADIDAEMKEAK